MNKKEMRKAWARSVNNKEYKPYKDAKYGNKIPGRIKAIHYLVYNIIRQLPKERGFEPIGDGYPLAYLNNKLKLAEHWKDNSYYKELLFPFEDTITIEEFKELL